MKWSMPSTMSILSFLTNKTEVENLVVDKWFVDKGVGVGKALAGEIVLIHASVV